jgi:glyoxylase-like metal-dependent hydrolase (beta-lactamase superfamily II)
VLTHAHQDHVGAAAEVAAWGDVTVLAHRADAPVIRGEFARLAALGPEIACFGHGEPMTSGAAAEFQAATDVQ